jgi:hypothetical protein
MDSYDEEEGYYCLDDSPCDPRLKDSRDGGTGNRKIRFSITESNNNMRSSNSMSNLDGVTSSSGNSNSLKARDRVGSHEKSRNTSEDSFDVNAPFPAEPRARKGSFHLGPPRRIRTISSIDG